MVGSAANFESGNQSSGAPNITGELASTSNGRDPAAVASNGGTNNAFTTNSQTAHQKSTINTTATLMNSFSIPFSATKSNAVYQSIAEVRPLNTTIKVWKRTK